MLYLTGTAVHGTGNSGDNEIHGNNEANVLVGEGGNDLLAGGALNDAVVYAGNRSNYQINLLADGNVEVVDLRPGSPFGTDTLDSIELIEFADETVAPVAPLGDVVWWHRGGVVAVGDQVVGTMTSSEIAFVGDFDGDADSDILFHEVDGTVLIWEMDGTTRVADHEIGNENEPWVIEGVGDFDGDGDDDILWRNDAGEVVAWEMQGSAYVASHNVENAAASWQMAGIADFDADGDDDILWHNVGGDVAIWAMEACDYAASNVLGVVPATWDVQGVGDFDGDGDGDILWGMTYTWEIEAGVFVASHDYGAAWAAGRSKARTISTATAMTTSCCTMTTAAWRSWRWTAARLKASSRTARC